MRKIFLTVAVVSLLGLLHAPAPSQSGGSFVIQKSTIAAGGDAPTGGPFVLISSMGEAAAGSTATGGPFGLSSGFWRVTSSGFSVSGVVLQNGGRGITNVAMTISGGPLLTPRSIRTGRRGSFQFDNVPPGYTYTLSAFARRFTFAPPDQTIIVGDNVGGLIFTGTR